MRAYYIVLIFAGLTASSCIRPSGAEKAMVSPEITIRKQALAIAENYASGFLNNGQKTTLNGLITMGDKQNMYVIDPKKIYIGKIDGDSAKDAIVTVAIYHGQDQAVSAQLILISTEGRIKLIKAVESDMDILWIRNGEITAEVPTHPRSSPLFNCSECRDVVDFQYKDGQLIRKE